MQKVATTPEPPYYAVIAPAELSRDIEGYPERAAELLRLAGEVDGFLGIEAAAQGGFAIAVSYWRSLEAIDEWRRNVEHLRAKGMGKARWFDRYITRIARVEEAY
jgi:heme-degrading monooxygenase HmoA